MSRTYRKTKMIEKESEINFLKRAYYYETETRCVRRPRTEEEIMMLKKKAKLDFDFAWKNATSMERLLVNRGLAYIREAYVSPWKLVDIPYPLEEQIAERKALRSKFARDSSLVSESSRSTGYKKACAKLLRNENKEFCNKVVKDDWEEIPLPSHRSGKKFIWSFW
jgi:hypothetical protein